MAGTLVRWTAACCSYVLTSRASWETQIRRCLLNSMQTDQSNPTVMKGPQHFTGILNLALPQPAACVSRDCTVQTYPVLRTVV